MAEPSYADLQTLILRTLITNETYTRKVIPFLRKDYFEGIHRKLFDEIVDFVGKYNALPTQEALSVELQGADITDEQYEDAEKTLSRVLKPIEETISLDWLIGQTETWCQDRAIYLAIMESIDIIDGKHKTLRKEALPNLLQDAIAVSFDTNVGHDYINDAEDRYEFYHRSEECIPFDLEYFNKITKGRGLPKKSLSIIMASTGVGKSLFMCHHAAAVLSQGKDVLYITMEMAEERIAERIDANLFNVALDQLETIPRDIYLSKVNKIAQKTSGKLIIKEYPTGAAHVGHFRALLNELKLKKNFEPDMIFVDYLNICASSRIKGVGGAVNTYVLVKSIAEELRGLAVEFKVPVMSATQSNREGFKNSEVDLDNTSESWGLPGTVDFMVALISTEDLEKLNQLMVKQLKNRYGDINKNKKFLVGLDRPKMRLYDLEESAQTLSTGSAAEPKPTNNAKQPGDKLDFTGFKM